ncbi:VanZ family protein [Cellulosilyticum sp. I15G10I2]|uniref:VanZ family protein n=1 Tax=Cellulosilyticum sp. I15G10I2 TaxID=1892843 RepID=UPI00085C8626|nr:VanZ family protein [Cellulosilyticum sp. I15G10I2]
MRIIKYYKLTLASTIFILIGILMPGGAVPHPGIPGLDKLVHFGMFAVLTFCFYFEYNRYKKKLPDFIYALIGISAFGLLTEVLQLFADARSFEFRDLAADILGVVAASWLFRMIRKNYKY